MHRLSYATRRVLALISVQGAEGVSYDDLAAHAGCERSTVRVAVRRLQINNRIEVIQGRGRQPNRYLLKDHKV